MDRQMKFVVVPKCTLKLCFDVMEVFLISVVAIFSGRHFNHVAQKFGNSNVPYYKKKNSVQGLLSDGTKTSGG